MGQVTIFLDNEIERKMRDIVRSFHLSESTWIENLIKEKIQKSWPESVIKLAGAWKDLPTAEEIRRTESTDIYREEF